MSNAYGKTVKAKKPKNDPFPKDPFDSTNEIKERATQDRVKKTDQFVSLSDKIARSTIVVRNWYIAEARKEFPLQDNMKRVDKYYPYAEGGPLLVDEPVHEDEALPLYKMKAPKMKEWGFRYAVIESDSTIDTVLKQLGDL